ncbi:ImmA/IrrE family metallo-endopeptidase [Corynebacterium felinum]|uniref:Zn-dependent peptidase ImmA (M78 family) n=1 Tax=Corynebacterium felinum TaxID=131318 RepID=A0ABU2BD27_9CORY|nr:ImmA/IrrE family metallo-endopeptidase [Corynebacterium felinum]MDF5820680.1 ImmA/IrrE family metallo-endopeptidase [Corynebacterium felinum]MDR7356256.1 Zn-dependent peptidase ImmA (M78 family) [Corynebacterium felinum]
MPEFKRITSWLDGSQQPTLRQAEALAAKAGTLFPYLLLDEPIEEKVDLPDFRTVGSVGLKNPSSDLKQVIEDCRSRLDWYVEYAQEFDVQQDKPLPTYTLESNPEQAAKEVRNHLGWEPGHYALGEKAVAQLSRLIENTGVLVMRSSVVRNNTHRPLDPEEFRGFTLIDRGFSLIFVNAQDTKSAQLFSLAHELGHVLLGEPGVSGEEIDGAPDIERWCNRFAAEFLIPASYFKHVWKKFPHQHQKDAIATIAHRLGVSPAATVWRGVDLKLINREDAHELIEECSYFGPIKKTSGGNGINNIRPRIGERFLSAAADAVGTDLLPLRDAMYYLGVKKEESARSLLDSVRKAAA